MTRIALYSLTLLLISSCGLTPSHVNMDMIPLPDELSFEDNYSKITSFSLPESLEIYDDWISEWNKGTSYDIEFIEDKSMTDSYKLDIERSAIKIKAPSVIEARNALSTLLQLRELNNGKYPIASISDKVEFEYRGMHLDVCRHMFSVDEIKQYLDYLAFYKFNNFHWHLTEDQGWRIEIKKYPKLQTIAAFRDETLVGHYNDQPQKYDGKKYGGYYSQEEVKDVVAYAKSRGIQVIPEIELPGHARAAIAAYPELGCSGEETTVATKWGVFDEVYCPKEETFSFLKDVMDEIIPLFPSKYIHIGGDECPKTSWKNSEFCQQLMKQKGLKDEYELQSYFIGEIADYLASKGKTIIGWDEILEGGLNEGSVVMSWRGEKGGIEAARAGHEVIMTPGSHCYFDHYQSTHPNEPVAIGGLTTVEDVYNYNVIPKELTEDEAKFVKGAQGNVWTEYISSFKHVEYMALARMTALSEALWNPVASRNFPEYQRRLMSHHSYWTFLGANMANHQYDVSIKIVADPLKGSVAHVENKLLNARLFHTNIQGENAELSSGSVILEDEGIHGFFMNDEKGRCGKKTSIKFVPHKLNRATIDFDVPPSSSYPGADPTVLINGVNGSDEKYGGDEWMGFAGQDFGAKITLNEEMDLNDISFRFFKGEGQWIYLPKSIVVQASSDGESYAEVAKSTSISTDTKVAEIQLPLNTNAKYLRIVVKNHGEIQKGKQGAGHEAWLFIDEIRVN